MQLVGLGWMNSVVYASFCCFRSSFDAKKMQIKNRGEKKIKNEDSKVVALRCDVHATSDRILSLLCFLRKCNAEEEVQVSKFFWEVVRERKEGKC